MLKRLADIKHWLNVRFSPAVLGKFTFELGHLENYISTTIAKLSDHHG